MYNRYFEILQTIDFYLIIKEFTFDILNDHIKYKYKYKQKKIKSEEYQFKNLNLIIINIPNIK